MTSLVSKIFEEIPFAGTYKKQCPDDVTFKDQGKLPLSPPEIRLEYKFEFGRLVISTAGLNDMNFINGSTGWEAPEKNFYDTRMDDLYTRLLKMLEDSRRELISRPEIGRYPSLLSLDVQKDANFRRAAVIDVEYSEEDLPFSHLEQELKKLYEISESKSFPTVPLHLELNNGIILQFYNESLGAISIVAPSHFPKEEYEKLKLFFLENPVLKEREPNINTKNIHVYNSHFRIIFGNEGHPLLEQAFKTDIEQLPKQEYT